MLLASSPPPQLNFVIMNSAWDNFCFMLKIFLCGVEKKVLKDGHSNFKLRTHANTKDFTVRDLVSSYLKLEVGSFAWSRSEHRNQSTKMLWTTVPKLSFVNFFCGPLIVKFFLTIYHGLYFDQKQANISKLFQKLM